MDGYKRQFRASARNGRRRETRKYLDGADDGGSSASAIEGKIRRGHMKAPKLERKRKKEDLMVTFDRCQCLEMILSCSFL